MTKSKTSAATNVCEKAIQKEIDDNIAMGIWPSHVEIGRRLLVRRDELTDAYAELHGKLHGMPYALSSFIRLIIETAGGWSPNEAIIARSERKRLFALNEKIVDTAETLADLLRERSTLENESGFSGETHYHVGRVIEDAAKDNYLFNSYVQEPMSNLRQQFSLKYWPRLDAVVQVLADDAKDPEIQASDPITAASVSSQKPSRADYLRAFFAALKDHNEGCSGVIPKAFCPGDEALASLANCALDLAPDELIDGSYVKNFRQRERKKAIEG